MKKTIMKTLLCSTLILSLTGCGLQNAAEDGTAKGQSRREDTGKEISVVDTEPAKTIPSVYPNYCTDNYFYIMDGMYIVQCDLDGQELQRFEMSVMDKKNKDEEISNLYVLDEEILCMVYCDDNKSGEYGYYEQVCSVPIWRDENGERLLVDQTEKLFRENSGLWLLYADKQVITYIPGEEGNMAYSEYDRVNKKLIPVNKDNPDEHYDLPLGKYGTWGGDCYGTVLLESLDSDDNSIYAHRAGSQEIQKVATHYIDRYSDGMHITVSEDGKVYYTCLHDGYTDYYENTDQYSYDIWCYDSATGDNSVIVSEEKIKEIEPEFSYIEKLFADGNNLYAYGIAETRKDAYVVLRISQDAEGKVEVSPETELCQTLNSRDSASVEDIAGNKCYITFWEEDNGHDVEKRFSFNLTSPEEAKEVTERDPEYWYWKFEDEELLD